MGQMFAAEIMTPHCTNYIARCIVSRVDADMRTHIPMTDVSATRLITAPEANSSQYLFNGYAPGYLDGLILQRSFSRAAVRVSRPKPPSMPLVPLSTPSSQADSASPTRTLSSRADSPSPTRLSSRAALSSPTPRTVPGKARPTTATLERAMEGVHIAAKSNHVRQPGTSLTTKPVNDWQAAVPGAYPTGTPYSDDKVTTNTHHNRKETVVPLQRPSRLQRRSSGRPLHLQGLQGSFGVRLSSATTATFDWEADGESVCAESVIAAVEREGMYSCSTVSCY